MEATIDDASNRTRLTRPVSNVSMADGDNDSESDDGDEIDATVDGATQDFDACTDVIAPRPFDDDGGATQDYHDAERETTRHLAEQGETQDFGNVDDEGDEIEGAATQDGGMIQDDQ